MGEPAGPRDQMPRDVYTVGDTIRVEVSFVCESNVEEVRATYVRQETILLAPEGGGDLSLSRLSMEGTVEETTIEESKSYALPLKRHTATLISLVDRDHSPGSYHLDLLQLRSAGGSDFFLNPGKGAGGVEADMFRIAAETAHIEQASARVVPDLDEE